MIKTNELYENLTQLHWLLHKQQMRDWAENGPMADMTRGQGQLLAVLKLRDGISTKGLSYLLGVSVFSLNELLAKVEKDGYVTCEPSEEDKRVMLVKLTEKGRNEQQPEPFDVDDIFSCLSDEEQEIFGEYIVRIITVLQTNLGENADKMFEKMEALRAKFGDMSVFFGEHGHGFLSRRGFPHGLHMDFGHGRFGYGGFLGSHGCYGHGKDEDEQLKGGVVRDDRC